MISPLSSEQYGTISSLLLPSLPNRSLCVTDEVIQFPSGPLTPFPPSPSCSAPTTSLSTGLASCTRFSFLSAVSASDASNSTGRRTSRKEASFRKPFLWFPMSSYSIDESVLSYPVSMVCHPCDLCCCSDVRTFEARKRTEEPNKFHFLSLFCERCTHPLSVNYFPWWRVRGLKATAGKNSAVEDTSEKCGSRHVALRITSWQARKRRRRRKRHYASECWWTISILSHPIKSHNITSCSVKANSRAIQTKTHTAARIVAYL